MSRCVSTYCSFENRARVLDIGSTDVNGSFKPLFAASSWEYFGLDLQPGKNVDVVLSDPYSFPFADDSVDLVISGSTFEHIEFFWLTWQEVCRVLRPNGGKAILIVPSRGPEHRYPIDAWRFYPDAMRVLAKFTNVRLLEASTDWEGTEIPGSAMWGDTVGVFETP